MDKMDMAKVNLGQLAKRSFKKATIYTPIVEGIVNAINAIEDKGIGTDQGVINVYFQRDQQQSLELGVGKPLPGIVSIRITDNGIGFNKINQNSFSTVYSDYKIDKGGLGFGRISYLKFFNNIHFNSKYEEEGEIHEVSWDFKPEDEFSGIDDNKSTGDTGTEVLLGGIKNKYINSMDKDFDVIMRRISENLLGFYAFGYQLPKIIFHDSLNPDNEIEISSFLGNNKKICKVVDNEQHEIGDKVFSVTIFKLYQTLLGNSFNLCANSREVIKYPIGDIDKLLQESFIDENEEKFSIAVYLSGEYFDENVNEERDGFDIQYNEVDSLLFPELSLSIFDILSSFKDIIISNFSDEYNSRESKKEEILNKFFNDNPMYDEYKESIGLMKWGITTTQQEIAIEVTKLELKKKELVYQGIEKIKDGTLVDEESINRILSDVSDINKKELAKYVINRKLILELLSEKLKYIDSDNASGKDSDFQKENVVHNIIYPMRRDSSNTKYGEHNLWLLDERLSYSTFISSDNSIEPKKKHGERGDIIFFKEAKAFREGDEKENPVIIVEFKRPGRKSYRPDEDPIEQVGEYAEKLRKGTMNNIKTGRGIKAGDNTPVYGYIIYDLTEPIRKFAKKHSIPPTYDNEGYSGFHQGYGIYFEIMSRDKVVKDATQRNRIFFKNLGIDKNLMTN